MTQLEIARKGNISPQMEKVAELEGLDAELIRQRIAKGTLVIPANPGHVNLSPCGVGEGLSTKVNANIGTSKDHTDVNLELKKLKIAVDAGADAVMDLSTGGNLAAIRKIANI